MLDRSEEDVGVETNRMPSHILGEDIVVEINEIPSSLVEEKKLVGFPILRLQVDAEEIWLVFRDGQLFKQLRPGRHILWSGFLHVWQVRRVNLRSQLLRLAIKGRLQDQVDPALSYKIGAQLRILYKIANVDKFHSFLAPFLVFESSIKMMVLELFSELRYDPYGQWAVSLSRLLKERLQSGKDNSQDLVGLSVDEVYTDLVHSDTPPYYFDFAKLVDREKISERLNSGYVPDASATISIRITEEPLTAQNFSNILSAFSELYTKCWLIASDQFVDLIEYMQTHNSRFDERSHLIIAKLSHNSPAEIRFNADISPVGVVEALKIAIDAVVHARLRYKEAKLAIQSKEQEIGTKEQEALFTLREKEQIRSIEAQKAELDKQKDLLEIEKKRIEIEKEKVDLQKQYLEMEKLRLEYAIETADKMVDVLNPGTDKKTKALLVQTLLPNLLQLGNVRGLELILPVSQNSLEAEDSVLSQSTDKDNKKKTENG